MAAAGGVNSRVRQAKSAFRVTHQISVEKFTSNTVENDRLHCASVADQPAKLLV